MSLWTKMMASTPYGAGGNINDFVGLRTSSGVNVTPDSALNLSTVFGCVRLLSETIAALPLVVYERRADGGRVEATNHPLFDLLHDTPNNQQTAMEFRGMLGAHALLRGNGYAQIVKGARGFADQLIPLHPDRVTPEELSDGSLRYQVQGLRRPLNDDEMLHLKGMSFDGKLGVSVVTYMRESVGLGLAAERYGARFFGNGAQPGGVLKKTDGKALSDGAAKRVKASWDAAHTGENQHKVAVLEEGLEYQAVGLSNKDSQFVELREHQAEVIAGQWFGVPPHMVGLTSKATSWGSGIEQMGIGFVVYTLLPWLKRWEQAISRDLIIAPKKYFVEHIVAALLRGDTQARFAAYAIAVGGNAPWMSRNEARRLENMNPLPGLDVILQPTSMGEAGAPAALVAAGARPLAAHYEALVDEAARRVVRKEIAAVNHRMAKADAENEIKNFYIDHPPFVAETLRIPLGIAVDYCAQQLNELTQRGLEATQDWEIRRVADLVRLTMEAQ